MSSYKIKTNSTGLSATLAGCLSDVPALRYMTRCVNSNPLGSLYVNTSRLVDLSNYRLTRWFRNLSQVPMLDSMTYRQRRRRERRNMNRIRKQHDPLFIQGGKEEKQKRKEKEEKLKKSLRKIPRKKKEANWASKYADFRRELKSAGIHVYEQHGMLDWAKNRILAQKTQDVVSFIEGITLLAGAVFTSSSIANLSFILLSYAKTHYRGSFLLKAQTLIKEFCYEKQGGEEPVWLSQLKQVNSDWKQAVSNPAFTKISELLGMFVAMGIMSTKYVDFEIANVRLFAKHVHGQHLTATNLTDAILSTVTFFAEGGYYAIKTGSLKPLLFGTQDLLKFDDEYIRLQSLFSAAVAGNLVKMDTTSEEFERRVDKFVAKGNELLAILPSGFERKIIQDRLVSIKKDYSEYVQKRLEGGSRTQPLMMSVWGKSGVGKSSLVDYIVPYILKINNFECSDEYITTINPSSKHQTNWRSYMTAMKLDDWNNSKADKTEINPAQLIINLCNNVRLYAEMAEIERKGKVVIEPKVISVTTNTRDLGARDFSNEPASIVRRPKLHIELKVKPEFQKDDSHELDSDKVVAVYGDSDVIIQDIWEMTISRIKIIPGRDTHVTKKEKPRGYVKRRVRGKLLLLTSDGPEECEEDDEPILDSDKFHTPDDYIWIPYEDEFGPLVDVGMDRFLPFLVKFSRDHFQNQDNLTEWTKEVGTRLTLCDECALPPEHCTCIPPEDRDRNYYEALDDSESLVEDSDESSYDIAVSDDDSFEEQGGSEFMHKAYCMLDTWWMKFSADKFFTCVDKWKTLEKNTYKFFSRFVTDTFPLVGLCEELTIKKCYDIMKSAEQSPWFRWTSYVPQNFLEDPKSKKYILRSRTEVVNQFHTCNRIMKFGLCSLLGSWMCLGLGYNKTCLTLFSLGAWALPYSAKRRKKCEDTLMRQIQQERDLMPLLVRKVREDYLKYTLSTFAFVAGVYSLYRLYKSVDSSMFVGGHQDGEIEDPTEDQVAARDAKGTDTFWLPKYCEEDFDSLPKSKWSNNAELTNIVKKNLLYLRFHKGDVTHCCNGLMLKTNYMLVPKHMLSSTLSRITCIRKPDDGKCRNSSFECAYDPKVTYDVKDHDLTVVYVPNSGDFANILPAFPETELSVDVPFTMNWRNKEGRLTEYRGVASPGRILVGTTSYRGCNYSLNANTFNGLCTAPLISQTKFPFIIGVHLAGITDTPTGAAGSPRRKSLEETISSLQSSHPTIFPSVAMGDFPSSTYGVKNFIDTEMKTSSPVLKVQGTNCRIYGRCSGDVHSKSNVRTLPMSAAVTREFGSENIWGPPKLKGPDGRSSWWPWQTNLESSLKPSVGLPQSLVARAYDDYVGELKNIIDQRSFWKKEIMPLTKEQVVNGIEGKRFIDRMPAKTSIGYPLCGPKSKFLTEIELENYTYACALDERFWDEAKRLEQCYIDGVRGYPIFKGSLKDTPTEVSADKVRVFQVAPGALQLLMRKYYLPIARFLSCNPLKSECAVGVNPHGPEWNKLHEFMSSKGVDRCMAIDYKKYDTRMPAQLMYSAFAVFIDIAVKSGNYTSKDIAIMRGIATEVCNAMIAYNGELIAHVGTNPSGQNLTVYINSIVNSLLHRCGFFHIYPDANCTFREAMALGTYGDDAKGTVDARFPKFNMVSYRDFLAEHDIKITRADKEAGFVEYSNFLEDDFLKRKSVWHEDLQLYLAAVDWKSVYKPMHIGLKSVVSDEIIMADALDNGLGEALYHGKEAYEDFRVKALRVAEDQKIDHLVRKLNDTYEHALYDWARKHDLTDRLDQAKYAEVAASKTKDSNQTLITEFPQILPGEEI